MSGKILSLRGLRNNVDMQCIPTTLYVVLQNQFHGEKRTNLNQISYQKLKKWTDWGAPDFKNRYKLKPNKEKDYYKLFHGNFNTDRFHLDLNTHIKEFNLVLKMEAGITSRLLKEKIDENKFPMLLINPQYIMEAKYSASKEKKIRGDPEDLHHFIAIHGCDEEKFYVYDSDLHHEKDEELNEKHIRCKVPFGVLQKYSQDIQNRIYWFELIETTKETKLTQYK